MTRGAKGDTLRRVRRVGQDGEIGVTRRGTSTTADGGSSLPASGLMVTGRPFHPASPRQDARCRRRAKAQFRPPNPRRPAGSSPLPGTPCPGSRPRRDNGQSARRPSPRSPASPAGYTGRRGARLRGFGGPEWPSRPPAASTQPTRCTTTIRRGPREAARNTRPLSPHRAPPSTGRHPTPCPSAAGAKNRSCSASVSTGAFRKPISHRGRDRFQARTGCNRTRHARTAKTRGRGPGSGCRSRYLRFRIRGSRPAAAAAQEPVILTREALSGFGRPQERF